jgi:branched-chain amino acid transport system permease protein
VGALIALQTLYVEPTSVFNVQYSVYMLFMVLIGGMGTIEGPVLGALVLFGLQEALSSYGAWSWSSWAAWPWRPRCSPRAGCGAW